MTTTTDDTPLDAAATPDGTAATWRSLIGRVLARRTDPRHAGYTAAIRMAAVAATEINTYAYTEADLHTLTPAQKIGARRAAGICASNPLAPQPKAPGDRGLYRPLGQSLRDLYIKAHGDSPSVLDSTGEIRQNAMLAQINSLPLLDAEQAAAIIGLLVQRCADFGITVDYFRLAETLIHWGNGINPASQRTRARVLTDFYTPTRAHHSSQEDQK